MRFIVDESTGPTVAEWLSSKGFEVFSVYEKKRGMPDVEILKKAFDENWIVITNDKDFGEMVFKQKLLHHGVILLRLNDERVKNKIAVLEILLTRFPEDIPEKFIVISDHSIRISG